MSDESPVAPREGKYLASVDELPDGKPVLRTIGRRRFLVVRLRDRVHVTSNICPHKGAALHEGMVCGTEIVCPCHQARFDLESGVPEGPPARDDLHVYDLAISTQEVRIMRPRPAQPWHIRKGTNKRRIVILGAGAAGSAAAESLRREGFDGRIFLVSTERELPYDRTVLSKGFLKADIETTESGGSFRSQAAAADMSGFELRPSEFYEQAEIDVLLAEEATEVEPQRKAVVFKSGKELRYDSLLVATGGNPRHLDASREHLPGMFALRSYPDAMRIKQAIASAERVVIVGAGFLGLELAGSLTARGLHVTVISRDALPLNSVFGEEVSQWIMTRHREQRISFSLGTGVDLIREHQRTNEVILDDGTLVPAQVVIEAIGIQPATGFLIKSGLANANGIPVDHRQATAAPDIYAAGDLALLEESSGESRRFEHWVDAEAQGRRAARALVGLTSPIESTHFFWTEVGCHTLKFLGSADPNAMGVIRGSLEESTFLAGYYRLLGDRPRLIGACAVGRDRELIAVGEHIRLGLSLTPQELADASLDLADHLNTPPESEVNRWA